ncbi:hypothetical protein NM688_g3782 [Phlebia brevispora]|uniref:Uncharacterized protein n=1 Tax=Phlebia brevispora TaxID=194682 RepID=A0ACC1T4X5_9APHY|nr:hypothetical protein NM688_g3782 [Phlebia brevispora]
MQDTKVSQCVSSQFSLPNMNTTTPADFPEWILPRLRGTIPEPHQLSLRFESYLYGPMTALLSGVFSASRDYMVSPQLIFVRAEAPDNGDSSLLVEDISVGEIDLGYTMKNPAAASTDYLGTMIPGRDLGPLRKGQFIVPDFLVLKVSVPYSYIKNDKLIAIVELKREEEQEEYAEVQIFGYVKAVYDKDLKDSNLSRHFRAFLVLGRQTNIYRMDQDGTSVLEKVVETVEEAGLLSELRILYNREG